MNCNDLGKRIKEARVKKGYTQAVLAEKIDSSTSYISDIERGFKIPSLPLFIKLINELEVPADYILQGSTELGKDYVYNEITGKLDKLNPKQRNFVSEFIDQYIKSLD